MKNKYWAEAVQFNNGDWACVIHEGIVNRLYQLASETKEEAKFHAAWYNKISEKISKNP